MGQAKEASENLKIVARSCRLETRDERGLIWEKWSVGVGKGKFAYMERVVVEQLSPITLMITHDKTHSRKQISPTKAISLMQKAGRGR